MVRSFGLVIPGTRNVYIFVPSIPRCVLLGSEFRELVMFTFLFPVFPDVFFWSFLLGTQFCLLFE